MREWMLKTVDYFIAQPNLQLIIRSHPNERDIDSNDQTVNTIRSHWKDLPENIHLLDPDCEMNTYGLIDVADLGLVYVSDVGFEMVARKKPVICAGLARYSDKGITLDPATREEYFNLIDQFAANPSVFEVSERQKELALCFANLYWHKVNKPFPWQPVALWENLKGWPMSRVLSPKGVAKFAEALGVLSGDSPDCDGFVGDLPTAATSRQA